MMASVNDVPDDHPDLVRFRETRNKLKDLRINGLVTYHDNKMWLPERQRLTQEFDNKVKACYKVFITSFSSDIIEIVRPELNKQAFRAAWKKLNSLYANLDEGTKHLYISAVYSRLGQLTYNDQTDSIAIHFQRIQQLFDEGQKTGHSFQ